MKMMRISHKHLKISEYTIPDPKNPADLLGKGAYGSVYKIKRNDHGKISEVAMKFISGELSTLKEQKDYMQEIVTLCQMNHPTLLSLIGYTIPMSDPRIMIATPLMSNGNLRSVMQKCYQGLAPEGFNETKKSICALGITFGMMFMHKKHILHRDLKSENVLLDDDFFPVISDFGMSKIMSVDDQNHLTMTLKVGTPLYLAPEIIDGDVHYNEKVDVFSYSMVLYELCTHHLPYAEIQNLNLFKVMKMAQEGKRPSLDTDEIPDYYKELMKKCWDSNPSSRPSFESIINEVKGTNKFLFPGADEDEYREYEDFIFNAI